MFLTSLLREYAPNPQFVVFHLKLSSLYRLCSHPGAWKIVSCSLQHSSQKRGQSE